MSRLSSSLILNYSSHGVRNRKYRFTVAQELYRFSFRLTFNNKLCARRSTAVSIAVSISYFNSRIWIPIMSNYIISRPIISLSLGMNLDACWARKCSRNSAGEKLAWQSMDHHVDRKMKWLTKWERLKWVNKWSLGRYCFLLKCWLSKCYFTNM